MIRAALLAGLLVGAASVGSAAERESRHLVVVGGIGGEVFYSDLFHRWATSMVDLARDHLKIDPGDVFYLAEDPSRDPGPVAGPSTKAAIGRVLDTVAERSAPGDLVMVVLIGHGTARGDRIMFNLPGPDLSADELSTMLDTLDGRRVVLVNTASSSGPFVPAVSRPGRVVITATASGAENQHPRFGGHFVTAFAAPDADIDKDGRVSLLEAFVYTSHEVARNFDSEKRLQTEHALLDDDGDGVGSRTPGGDNADGHLAARLFLSRPDAHTALSSRALALRVAARALVDRIELWKRRKRELSETDYEAQLESLLVELALNRRAQRAEVTP